MDPLHWHFWVALLGLILGSFATACVHRIPREIPLGLFKKTRSACPHCERQIPWRDNIPLFSYLRQRGKARCCKKAIPVRYFLIELLTPLLFLATYMLYLRRIDAPFFESRDYFELAKLLYFTWSLVVLCFIDLEFRIIPDRFSLGNWVIALAAAFLWQAPPFLESVAGCVLGFGMFFLMAWGYEKLKKVEGLGFGDVKMMGWLGAWLGIFGVPFVVLTASLTGLVAGLVAMRFSKAGLQTAIPFGPFLALGAYLAWALQSLGMW